MSFSKIERANFLEKKYDNFDASSLFYDEIPQLELDISKEIIEMVSIVSWFAECRACGVEYGKAFDHATHVKNLLNWAANGIKERKKRLERVKQQLEDEGETDEEYFERNFCRPEKDDENEKDRVEDSD